MNKEIPQPVKAKLNEWLTEANVLHFWEQDGTYFIVASSGQQGLYFIRIFSVGDTLQLSQDREMDA